jgi:hypothetical protein
LNHFVEQMLLLFPENLTEISVHVEERGQPYWSGSKTAAALDEQSKLMLQ